MARKAEGLPKVSKALPEGEYLVHVGPGPLPSMTTLRGCFSGSEEGVSAFFGRKYVWGTHPSCSVSVGVRAPKTGEVVVVVKRFSRKEARAIGGLTRENIINWGLERGLVPAQKKVVYSFGVDPEMVRFRWRSWLVGLGSSFKRGTFECVAGLVQYRGKRCLQTVLLYEGAFNSSTMFLFVRGAALSQE